MILGTRYLVYYAIVYLALPTKVYTATNPCYAPNGGPVAGDIPCGTSSDTFCCGADSFCLTNQICQYIPNGQYGRGSCTDMTWNGDGGCPNFCIASDPSWGALVFYCGNGNWCCPNETSNDCCSTSSFWLAKGEPTIFGEVQNTGFSATASSEISSLSATVSTTVSGPPSDLVPSLVLEAISTGLPPAPTPHTAVPPYTGSGNLLQDYCATPEYVLLDGPTAYWAPIVGCAGGKTDCCPYSVTEHTTAIVVTTVTAVYTVTVDVGPEGTAEGGYAGFQAYPTPISADLATLAHCPADYQTVSGRCCPSGYQLWNAELGGQVPCYSSLSSYLVPPAVPVTSIGSSAAATSTLSGTPTSTPIPTSAVVNVVFAIQYNVLPSTSSLSTGAKAGIGVGASVAGIAIIALSLLLVWRTQKHNKDKKALAAIQATGQDQTRQDQVEKIPQSPVVYSMRTELQSDDVNPPVHTPGNMVSQEQRGYYPQQPQQQMQTQEGIPYQGYYGPQQGQSYMQQQQSQTGYAAIRNPGDQFVSSTVSAQPGPHG